MKWLWLILLVPSLALSQLNQRKVSLDTLRSRTSTGPINYYGGLGTKNSFNIGHYFYDNAGNRLIGIEADSVLGGVVGGVGDPYYQLNGRFHIDDFLSVENNAWFDEGMLFTNYQRVTDTVTVKVANTAFQYWIRVTNTPSWIKRDNEVIIGTTGVDRLSRRITRVSGDTVYFDKYVNFSYSPGTSVKLNPWRAGIGAVSNPYLAGGVFRLGLYQTPTEANATHQSMEYVPNVNYVSPLGSLFLNMVMVGGVVRARSPAGMYVSADSGSALTQRANVEGLLRGSTFDAPFQDSLAIGANSSGSTRIDLVYWDQWGVAKVYAGTPGGGLPSTPAGGTLLASVSVANGATSITSGNITDRRTGTINLNPINNGLVVQAQTSNGNVALQGHSTNGRYQSFLAYNEASAVKSKMLIDVNTGSLYLDYFGAGSSGSGTFNIRNGIDGSVVFNLNTTGAISTYGDSISYHNNSHHLTLKVPTLSADQTYTLPPVDGSNKQVLATNAGGVLYWKTDSTGGGGGDSVRASHIADTAKTAYIADTAKAAWPGYKEYVALVSQTGTSDPTATVLKNTLGATITFAYVSQGTYTATASSAVLTAGKTAIINTSVSVVDGIIEIIRNSTTVLYIYTKTYDSGLPGWTNADDVLSDSFIEIRVYP